MMVTFFILLIILNIVKGQPSCSIQNLTPTSSCLICQSSSNIYLMQQTPTPTPQTAHLCPYCNVIYTCDRADVCQVGADQTTAQIINMGQTTPAGAPTMPTSSKITKKGRFGGFYTNPCSDTSGYSGCFVTFSFTGRPRCACGSEQTNMPVTTSAFTGYYFPSTGVPSSSDAFYPNSVGYWMFHYQCMGSGVSGTTGVIRVRKTSDNSIIRSSIKTGNPTYSSLHISVGYGFSAVGASTNGVYFECVNCEIGQNGYCQLTVSKVA